MPVSTLESTSVGQSARSTIPRLVCLQTVLIDNGEGPAPEAAPTTLSTHSGETSSSPPHCIYLLCIKNVLISINQTGKKWNLVLICIS